jgi:adenylosuccinate lyase
MRYGSKKQKSNQPRCKTVEYFIKDAFEKLGLSQYKEFIHFGLTSQDTINSSFYKRGESIHAFSYFDF